MGLFVYLIIIVQYKSFAHSRFETHTYFAHYARIPRHKTFHHPSSKIIQTHQPIVVKQPSGLTWTSPRKRLKITTFQ
ncbi:hypothetical protein BKA69DRAFT_681590 [Paraphysoderma sedebokerense]|nr:hypothetical protein BKA69DRAFT_681590 [Paraphysoderma sedebokerense]